MISLADFRDLCIDWLFYFNCWYAIPDGVEYDLSKPRPSSGQRLRLLLSPRCFKSWLRSNKMNWWKMNARKYCIIRCSCRNCTPYLEYYNALASEAGPIPSLSSTCPFCVLVGLISRHYFHQNAEDYTYTSNYSSIDELYLTFSRKVANTPSLQIQVTINDAQTSRQDADPTLKVCADPLAAASLSNMKQWIDKCMVDHPECALGSSLGDPSQAVVPKRLVKLVDRSLNYACLVSTQESVRYSALTYCWGNSKQPGTTRENLLARHHELCVAELPKTLQDAIKVAYGLGYQYIWIDSLCIVQDDEDDWAQEASRMAHIYIGAEIVIAATQASDCAEGFLHARDEPLRITPSDFQYQGLSAIARRTTSHDLMGRSNVLGQPLYSRAWVMQERELARRIIHFLPDEVLWRCRTTVTCECGFSQDSDHRLSIVLDLCKNASSTGDGSEIAFGIGWVTLVKQYLKLELTYSSDLLPALSGIAAFIHRQGAGNYLVGMWGRGIVYQLAWYRSRALPGRETPQSPILTMPTFSWVAASGPISWNYHNEESTSVRCVCIDSASTPSTSNPFGPANSCSITMRGMLLHSSKFMPRAGRFSSLHWDHEAAFNIIDCFEYYRSKPETHMNFEETAARLQSIFGLQLLAHTSLIDPINASTVLLLQKGVGETHYTRVGIAWSINTDWFDADGIETTVVIR